MIPKLFTFALLSFYILSTPSLMKASDSPSELDLPKKTSKIPSVTDESRKDKKEKSSGKSKKQKKLRRNQPLTL